MLTGLHDLLRTLAWPITLTLMHFLWQGGLVALVLAGVLSLLQRRSAATRHACACLALVIMVALPVATFLSLPDGGADGASVPFVAGLKATEALATGAGGVASSVDADGRGAVPADPAARFWWRERQAMAKAAPWVFTAWLIGVVALSAWNLRDALRARRWTRHGTEPVPEAWRRRVAQLCARLGIRRAVRLVASALVDVPSVVGWLRPVVLVPVATLNGLPADLLETVLLHELAHIRRSDYLVNLLQIAAETLLFYHPAVWWVSAQIRAEREHCCDDVAVAVSGNRLAYARALLSLEELRPGAARYALGAADGSLMQRIRRLSGGAAGARSPFPSPRLGGALLALLLLAAGAALALTAQGPAPSVGRSVIETDRAPAPGSRGDEGGKRDVGVDGQTISGHWSFLQSEDRDGLELEREPSHRRRSLTLWLSADERSVLRSTTKTVKLRRDAGTVRLTIDGSRAGSGTFVFLPDGGFAAWLAERGVRSVDDEHLFALACLGVDMRWVKQWHELGYDDLDADELVALGTYEVTPDFVREFAELGYADIPAEQLLAMKIYRICPDYVRDLARLGLKNRSVDELVAMGVHDITIDDVARAMQGGMKYPRLKTLPPLKTRGVEF